ncbi:hypothetical protein Q3G72_027742 [Acer saccharum]|nr:hypothetical protein Q3G72_027742 [Acer saccharum]
MERVEGVVRVRYHVRFRPCKTSTVNVTGNGSLPCLLPTTANPRQQRSLIFGFVGLFVVLQGEMMAGKISDIFSLPCSLSFEVKDAWRKSLEILFIASLQTFVVLQSDFSTTNILGHDSLLFTVT